MHKRVCKREDLTLKRSEGDELKKLQAVPEAAVTPQPSRQPLLATFETPDIWGECVVTPTGQVRIALAPRVVRSGSRESKWDKEPFELLLSPNLSHRPGTGVRMQGFHKDLNVQFQSEVYDYALDGFLTLALDSSSQSPQEVKEANAVRLYFETLGDVKVCKLIKLPQPRAAFGHHEDDKRSDVKDWFKELACGITQEHPVDPVLTSCGSLYDREAIQKWLDSAPRPVKDPLTRKVLPDLNLHAIKWSDFKDRSEYDSLVVARRLSSETAETAHIAHGPGDVNPAELIYRLAILSALVRARGHQLPSSSAQAQSRGPRIIVIDEQALGL